MDGNAKNGSSTEMLLESARKSIAAALGTKVMIGTVKLSPMWIMHTAAAFGAVGPAFFDDRSQGNDPEEGGKQALPAHPLHLASLNNWHLPVLLRSATSLDMIEIFSDAMIPVVHKGCDIEYEIGAHAKAGDTLYVSGEIVELQPKRGNAACKVRFKFVNSESRRAVLTSTQTYIMIGWDIQDVDNASDGATVNGRTVFNRHDTSANVKSKRMDIMELAKMGGFIPTNQGAPSSTAPNTQNDNRDPKILVPKEKASTSPSRAEISLLPGCCHYFECR